jgi:hypothetical protein
LCNLRNEPGNGFERVSHAALGSVPGEDLSAETYMAHINRLIDAIDDQYSAGDRRVTVE